MELDISRKQLEALHRSLTKEADGINHIMWEAIRRRQAGPRVVCLCGSTRFGREFREENARLTLDGYIVLSIGCNMKSDLDLFAHLSERELQLTKEQLDELHLCKIERADMIRVINVGGYIGESTSIEIAYAAYLCKPMTYLEN